METLFLHGFRSGPTNHSDDWLSPKLDYVNVEETLEYLKKYVEVNNVSFIVAKSIGCYFALALNDWNRDLILFLINPSLDPYNSLAIHAGGVVHNYQDNTPLNVPQDFAIRLKEIDSVKEDGKFYFSGMAFLEYGDEVVNQHKNENLLRCLEIQTFEGGNHRYSRMSQTVDYINNFIKYHF